MKLLDEIKSFTLNISKEISAYYSSDIYIVKKPRTPEGIDSRILAYADKNSYIAEQYKALRTSLYSLFPQKPLKTILLTSAQSGEGKTITSCNLAITISLDTEKKVLLIDTDLRKPEVHHIFGIQRKPGFSELIAGKVSLDDLIRKPTIGNLYVMPAGTLLDNPSEILVSAKIKSIIEILKTRFDYIIFDSAPALNITDTSILGALCDGVIMVVKANTTQMDLVKEAFNLLRDAQAKPIATILTNYRLPIYNYGKYKYYYKYSYAKK